MILSGIAQPSTQVQAVCVKFIFIRSILGDLKNNQVVANMPEPDTVADAVKQMAKQKGVQNVADQ